MYNYIHTHTHTQYILLQRFQLSIDNTASSAFFQTVLSFSFFFSELKKKPNFIVPFYIAQIKCIFCYKFNDNLKIDVQSHDL